MKLILQITALAIFLSLNACDTGPEPGEVVDYDSEVERRVEERLADERRAARERELEEREGIVTERERTVVAQKAAPRKQVQKKTTRRTTRSYEIFYDRLDPYGEWIEVDRYGYVWHPRDARRESWRPYTRGRWVYSDYGWTWISEEPYGWATYHYGRWTRIRGVGWVWVPGDEWAPAWVSWRSGDEHVGWAPLPPEAEFERGRGFRDWVETRYDIAPTQYVFVPVEGFGAREIERVVVAPQRNTTIINNTRNVTNISYTNNTVVNEGPRFDVIAAQSAQPIERLKIERRAEMTDEPRSVVENGRVILTAPVLAETTEPARPKKVSRRIEDDQIEQAAEIPATTPAAEEPPGPEAEKARATPAETPAATPGTEIEERPRERGERQRTTPAPETAPSVAETPAEPTPEPQPAEPEASEVAPVDAVPLLEPTPAQTPELTPVPEAAPVPEV
jgi:hypothetical protein